MAISDLKLKCVQFFHIPFFRVYQCLYCVCAYAKHFIEKWNEIWYYIYVMKYIRMNDKRQATDEWKRVMKNEMKNEVSHFLALPFLHFFWMVLVCSQEAWSPFFSVNVRDRVFDLASQSDHAPFTYRHGSEKKMKYKYHAIYNMYKVTQR